MPVPEPTARDEELALEFLCVKDRTNLRGRPEGGQRCDSCHFYADPTREIAYCWHDELEMMVGGAWCCDRWEHSGAPARQPSPEDRRTAMQRRFALVEDQQWAAEPKSGEQCNACRYYLAPDDSVSYCWHPELQVGVGFDHCCRRWQAIPGQA